MQPTYYGQSHFALVQCAPYNYVAVFILIPICLVQRNPKGEMGLVSGNTEIGLASSRVAPFPKVILKIGSFLSTFASFSCPCSTKAVESFSAGMSNL